MHNPSLEVYVYNVFDFSVRVEHLELLQKYSENEVTMTKIAGSIPLAAKPFFPFFPAPSIKKGLNIHMVNSAW